MEGFGQVIVGAGIQAFNLFLPAVAGSKDQHRGADIAAASLTNNVESVEFRQTNINNCQVVIDFF